MSALEEMQDLIAASAASAGPAVVGVGSPWGRGSGVVVAEGRVVTNAHNVRGGEVRIGFADGRAVEGVVAGADADAELAVIEVDTGSAAPVELAAAAPGVGAPVVALANPGGRGLHATPGFVSAVDRRFRGPRGRRIGGAFEHTAPMVRGASGGPVLDADGRVLGINTHRLDGGLYLALPADDELAARVDTLARGDALRRVRLGIAVAPPAVARRLRSAVGLPERGGLLIRDVAGDGPAAAAGLASGDLIVGAAGAPVTSTDDLFEVLDRHDPDEALTLDVVRGVEELSIDVMFGDIGGG